MATEHHSCERREKFEIGVVLPNHGCEASAAGVARVAEAAEDLSFDSVWTTEHLLVGKEVASLYGSVLDPINCLSWIAAKFERVKLGTSLVLAPLHHPVQLAKVAATLQELSGGRLRLGIGTGWHEPEFRFLGYGFADRGRRTDEAVALMRSLWAGKTSFTGEYHSFEDAHFGPLPEPAPEIWVGGNSARALQRARELGDAFQPLSSSPEDVREAKQFWPEGRIYPRYELRLSQGSQEKDAGLLQGSPYEVAERITALRTAGAAGILLWAGPNSQDAVSLLCRFKREVVPRMVPTGSELGDSLGTPQM